MPNGLASVFKAIKNKLYKERLFISLLPLKHPLSIPLNLHVLMPVWGGLEFAINRSLHKTTLILLLLPFYSFVLNFFYFSEESLLRTTQLIFIILFYDKVLLNLSKKDFKKILRGMVILAIIFAVIEIFVFGPYNKGRAIFGGGFSLPRFHGVVGETNFTAFLLLGTCLMLCYWKDWWFSLCAFFAGFLTGSRMFLLGTFVFVFLSIFQKLKFNKRYFYFLAILSLFLSPVFYFLIEKYSSGDFYYMLNKDISSHRMEIYGAYSELFMDNPFGVGYFQGRERMYPYYENFFAKLDEIHGMNLWHSGKHSEEQHSHFVQVLTEFGFLGYITFFWFVARVLNDAFSPKNQRIFLVVLPLMTCFMFLNLFHEVMFYMMFAFIVVEIYEKNEVYS